MCQSVSVEVSEEAEERWRALGVLKAFQSTRFILFHHHFFFQFFPFHFLLYHYHNIHLLFINFFLSTNITRFPSTFIYFPLIHIVPVSPLTVISRV